METLLPPGLATYALVLSLPVRLLLFMAYLYLQNVTALLHMIQDGLILLLSLLLTSASFVHRKMRRGRVQDHYLIPGYLILRVLVLIHKQMANASMVVHIMAESLRIPGATLTRLSRIYRLYSHSRTWLIMLQREVR
ncbi:hypothetical protein KR009_002859 [Drosophila setifemur]|nr:hypothetical protein KR009_002859 [Drosophila setifemur]